MDRWVRNFRFLNYYDSFDGHHPNVFVPRRASAARVRVDRGDLQLPARPQGGRRLDRRRGRRQGRVPDVRRGDRARWPRRSGSRSRSRRAALRTRLDSKIETTRIGDEAGVPSVPNVLGRAASYDELTRAGCARPGIGDDLVVQTPYGDSGPDHVLHRLARPTGTSTPSKLVDEELKVMRGSPAGRPRSRA